MDIDLYALRTVKNESLENNTNQQVGQIIEVEAGLEKF